MRRPLFLVLVVLVVAASWLARPLGNRDYRSRPAPAADRADALRRLDAVRAEEAGLDLGPLGGTLALLQDDVADTAVVIFHGYTDVPAQFAVVARAYHDAGASVYVPRLPYHGLRDRLTDDPSRLTPDILRAFADAAVDVGRGLGRHVLVLGFSGGGALATWVAAERDDVARVIVVSPLILPRGYRPWMLRPVARLLLALPDTYRWWDDRDRGADADPDYPRYSLHGICAFLMLVERAKAGGAATAELLLIANAGDQRLDMAPAEAVLRDLEPPGGLRVFTIPASAGLGHNLFSPWGENAGVIASSYGYLGRALGLTLAADEAMETRKH
jgi:dienelactone hydrolase